MDGDIISCMPGNPFRRPRWRWNRALYLANGAQPAGPDIDDDWVMRATTYLAVGSGAHRPSCKPRQPNDPVVAAAASYWNENSEVRWRLEALALANEAPDAIAEQCGLPIDVVDAYEAIFFDARRCLAARDWVVNNVLGGMRPPNIRRQAPASLWRIAGFFGGPHILADVIAVTMNRPMPRTPPERLPGGYASVQQYQDHIRRKCQMWIATLTAETPSELAEVGREMLAFAQDHPRAADNSDRRARMEISYGMLALLDAKPKRAQSQKAQGPKRSHKPVEQGRKAKHEDDGGSSPANHRRRPQKD